MSEQSVVEDVPAVEGGSRRRFRKRAVVVLVLAGLLLVGVVCVGVAGWQAVQARDELKAAEGLSREIESDLRELKISAAQEKVAPLQGHTKRADELLNSVLWRAAARLPKFGDDVAALQVCVGAVDDLSVKVIPKIVGVAASIDPENLAPKDGRIDVAPMVSAREPLDGAVVELGRIKADVDAIDVAQLHEKLVPQVSRLQSTLESTAVTTKQARDVVVVAPGLLGADGPRDILVLFQNNAELRSRGGIIGATAVLRVDNGSFELVGQGSSADYGPFPEPVLPLGDSLEVHDTRLGRYIQNVTLTPHFPMSAVLAKEMYKRSRVYQGREVSAVVAMDPVALSYLLKGAGEVPLPGGKKLTSENLVKSLLNTVYFEITDSRKMDDFFAASAALVFEKVSSGVGGAGAVNALERSVAEQRLLVWSEVEKEQAVLAKYPLGGLFTYADNAPNTLGVFFSSATASKLSYYMKSELQASPVCVKNDDGESSSVGITVVKVKLDFDAPTNAATFPYYLSGDGKQGVPKGHDKTLVSFYAPKGTSVASLTLDGEPAPYAKVSEHGLDVAILDVELAPKAKAVVEVQLSGVEPGDMRFQFTPMAKPNPVKVKKTC